MTENRKVIPIQSTPDERTEIGSCAEAEPYALRVIGDSMAPEFLDGQVVVVDPAMIARTGAYVICDYAGETLLRQFVVDERGTMLRPLNAAYPTITLLGGYRVRGVVAQRAGRRRKDRKYY